MPGKCKFQEVWLTNAQFSNWIERGRSNGEARCKVCMKSFDIQNMGEAAVKSHMKSKKHVDAAEDAKGNSSLRNFLPVAEPVQEQPVPGGAARTPDQPSKPKDITSHFSSNEHLAAEVLWALKVVLSHYSYKSCEDIAQLFERMFPDSAIASKFSCGEKKCAYLACFGIAPFFHRHLLDEVKKLEDFVLLFDESQNKVTQTKQMDVHIRFWDKKNESVQTRYLTSSFMGHGTANDLLVKMTECLNSCKIDKSKILQISMDGPNVNWKFHDLMQEQICEAGEDASTLINVGSCGLHVVHNAFKTGAKASEWNIEEILSSLYWLFVDSPARRQDFTEITASDVFPLKFCKHRWLENVPVVLRAQEIWDKVIQYVRKVQIDKKYCEPTSKSFKIVRDAVQDPLMPAKMAAFESVANQLHPFLALFQSDNPLLPFMVSTLQKIIEGLMKRFVKSDVLQKATSALKLLKVDLSDKNIYLEINKVDPGFVAVDKLKKLQADKKVSDRQIYQFKSEFKSFLSKAVSKLFEKTPIAYSLARNLMCLDPNLIVQDKEACCAKFKVVLKKLVECKRMDMRDCDSLVLQYSEFVDRAIKVERSAFEEFSFKIDRLDVFLQNHITPVSSLSKLWDLIRKLLILSHGQASVERGFSVNRQVMIENMKEQTFIAQRIIHDHILSIGGLNQLVVCRELLTAASGGRQRYLAYLEEQKAEKQQAAKNNKRKAILEEKAELEKKKKRLASSISALQFDADSLAKEAEEKAKLILLSKSNALRKSAKEKEGALEKIEDELRELTKKSANL